MERFELTMIAQGSQSVWVALLVMALLCGVLLVMLLTVYTKYRLLMVGAREGASRPAKLEDGKQTAKRGAVLEKLGNFEIRK